MVLIQFSCDYNLPDAFTDSGKATIYPDYTGLTIPVNIAPLNFIIRDQAEQYLAHFKGSAGGDFIVRAEKGQITIPERKWKSLLAVNRKNTIAIDLYLKNDGQWHKHASIVNYVSSDSIDPYLVYRLIEPGYETWNEMGIYQRNLERFEEEPVMINSLSDGNCMNCHAFAAHDPETMLFHSRFRHAGTIIRRKGKWYKVNTDTDSTISAGVYPAWHPGGRYVTFSVNHIVQSFHALPDRRIEVIDTLSDLILYDAAENRVIQSSMMSSTEALETFPHWSGDGKFLYYCSAGYRNYRNYMQVRYNLMRVPFDAETETFGRPDTVIDADRNGFSVSFPRVSPDGKYLLFCNTQYGNFTIWHDHTDLNLLNLETGQITIPEINSDQTESYHTWSSTGRWIVFSSRREDGLYTRLYFSYFDKAGKMHKPFLLPQKDPEYNAALLKSYNVPELITARINPGPRKLAPIVKSTAAKAVFNKTD
jgi:hypothetical protein